MAAIVRQRLLRTGDLEFSANTASDVDQYFVYTDVRVNKVQIAQMFVAFGTNPIPRQTLKQLGTNYLICDRIRCSQTEPNQSLIWRVEVSWKEIESDQPQNQSGFPTPNSGSINPDDWTPTWSRRAIIVHEPAATAFYKGGFSGVAHAKCSKDPTKKRQIVNSALVPVETDKSHRRLQVAWSFKWLRKIVPQTLIDAEGKINKSDFICASGYSHTWAAGTALFDSMSLSKMRWGNTSLVEISVEIIVDPLGWAWKFVDQGTAARALVGDPDARGNTISLAQAKNKPAVRQLIDISGRSLQDPCFLDGDGQPLIDKNKEPVVSDWLDFDEVDYNTVALLKAV